jgi:hypothetical protein
MWMLDLFKLYFFSFMFVFIGAAEFTVFYCGTATNLTCPKAVKLPVGFPIWTERLIHELLEVSTLRFASKLINFASPVLVELFVYIGLISLLAQFFFSM